jgi:hypothetical protein
MVSSLLFFRAHVERAVRHRVPGNERRDFTPNDGKGVNREIAGATSLF